MKIGQRSRPRMPSIDEGHSRACVNRCRARVRSRDGFRYGPTLGAPSPAAPCALLSRYAQGFDWLDPRPRPSSHSALFTRSADRRFSGPDCRSPTSATASLFFRRVGTPTSTRFSHLTWKIRTLADPRARPRFRSRFTDYGPPLTKKLLRACEPRQPFRQRPHDAASAPHDTFPEAAAQPRRRLRATPKPNRRLRRRLLDDNAGLHGPRSLERRTFLCRQLLPQVA
jgi:hypothetical protein